MDLIRSSKIEDCSNSTYYCNKNVKAVPSVFILHFNLNFLFLSHLKCWQYYPFLLPEMFANRKISDFKSCDQWASPSEPASSDHRMLSSWCPSPSHEPSLLLEEWPRVKWSPSRNLGLVGAGAAYPEVLSPMCWRPTGMKREVRRKYWLPTEDCLARIAYYV